MSSPQQYSTVLRTHSKRVRRLFEKQKDEVESSALTDGLNPAQQTDQLGRLDPPLINLPL